MKNSGLKRKMKPNCGLERAPMKRTSGRRRKITGLDAKYIASCQKENCYLRICGVCKNDSETVVACHSNEQIHGKGMGITAEHKYTVPGCVACHSWLDQGKNPKIEKFKAWREAYEYWEPVRAIKLGISLEKNNES